MISSFIYRRTLYGNRVTKRLYRIIRRLVIRIDEQALCSMKVHDRDLVMPLSHALPLYWEMFPFYDRLPARLAEFIRGKLASVKCIDVGANVGDTIAAFKRPIAPENKLCAERYLAIEPNPRFRKCLELNWGRDRSVTILPYICSSSGGDTSACVNESNGTASIELTEDALPEHKKTFEKRTIDSIVSQYELYGEFNVLKSDTDGHDFEVLCGAKEFIMNSTPFLYFEVDSFSNPQFVEECLGILEFLSKAGYKRLFIYDNFGNFVGLFEVTDVASIKRLLFYKLTKQHYYFDFLLMRDCFVAEFYMLEQEYFIKTIQDARLYQAIYNGC